MNRTRENKGTLQNYLEELRKDKTEPGLTPLGEHFLIRLELVERLVPSWLEFDFWHDVRIAVLGFDAINFGTLIGRAIVLPTEYGEYFADPEVLWNAAKIGLGVDERKRGRSPVVGEAAQMLIYTLWNSGQRTQQEIADDFDIGLATVGRIIKRWKEKEEYF